ncbi:MAG: thioredoxin domain-containing protein [Terrimesophilobacter sp.]
MTIANGTPPSSKNQRRDSARDKARQLREEQKKKDFRNRLILQGSLVVVLIAIAAAIFLVITTTVKPIAQGPRNMMTDGITIGQDLEAVRTRALPTNSEPIPAPSNPSSVVDIRVYVDYMCPVCGSFEKANGALIKQMVSDGSATIEIHPVAILDRFSQGARYSSRAANAAACVSNFSPDNFFAFNTLLFDNQPEENSPGLTDGALIELAKESGVVSTFKKVSQCIENQDFKTWVVASSDRFGANEIPNVATQPTDTPEQHGTPTIYVNGQFYRWTLKEVTSTNSSTQEKVVSYEFDPSEFSAFITKVLGADFAEKSVQTPTETPTPSPTP